MRFDCTGGTVAQFTQQKLVSGASRLLDAAKPVATKLLDAVLPSQCVHCHDFVAQPGLVCGACWSELSFIEHPLCDHLGTPFVFDPGPDVLSAEAQKRPRSWSRARAAVEYGDVAKSLIHGLKYHDRAEGLDLLARTMVRAGREMLAEADLVVPVPLHKVRQWQRRFNQSAELARRIAALSGVAFEPTLLKRVRATRQQAGLQSRQRRDNVNGAFAVDEAGSAALFDRRVVLVDDVMTTGSTLEACSRVLLDAGCSRVDVLVFALVNNSSNEPF